VALRQVPGTNGTVRLGSERKFSSGTWKIFVILPRALAIDDDFKNLPWLKFRIFLASDPWLGRITAIFFIRNAE
jgi:hypothetical protein